MTNRHGTISDFFLKLTDLSLLVVSLGVGDRVPIFARTRIRTFVVDYFSERVKVTNAILGALLLFSWYAAFAAQGLYVSHRLSSRTKEVTEIARAVGICASALLVAAQFGRWPTISLRTVALGLPCSVLLVIVSVAIGVAISTCGGCATRSQREIAGDRRWRRSRGERFAAHIKRRHDLGYKILGYVDSDPVYASGSLEGAKYLGTIEELPDIIANEVIDEVAVALPIKSHYSEIEKAVGTAGRAGNHDPRPV